MKNPFFLNTGPHEIDELLKSLKLKLFGINDSVKDVKDLNSAQASDITFSIQKVFWNNKNYKSFVIVLLHKI